MALSNPIIRKNIDDRKFFEFDINNKRLQIICSLTESPVDELRNYLDKILTEELTNTGYYHLRNLFVNAQSADPNSVIRILVDLISNKIATISDTMYDPNNTEPINLEMYTQIWKSYKDFTQNIYAIINVFQDSLVKKNITIRKSSHDILSIIQICMYYDKIFSSDKIEILSTITDDIKDINKKNIDQLIDYIDSARAFLVMQDFTTVNKEKILAIIKRVMCLPNVINTLCWCIHNSFTDMKNKHKDHNKTLYTTSCANENEKHNVRKINKISAILSAYGDKSQVLAYYTKFMQIRIVDWKYDQLELEIDIVKKLSGLFGKEASVKLLDSVGDIINTRNATKIIHSANIKVRSAEYAGINISTKILHPIVLTKNSWKIYNTSKMAINYPTELKCYLDIMSKAFASVYEGKYIIDWQPTLGNAQFNARLGGRSVHIMCNVLQAIALVYMNDNPTTCVEKFSRDTLINELLSQKILDSLFEANIITCVDSVYIINDKNYSGDVAVDIRKSFIEVFEIEIDAKDMDKYIADTTPANINNVASVVASTEFDYNTLTKFKPVTKGKGKLSRTNYFRQFIRYAVSKIKGAKPNTTRPEAERLIIKGWNKYYDECSDSYLSNSIDDADLSSELCDHQFATDNDAVTKRDESDSDTSSDEYSNSSDDEAPKSKNGFGKQKQKKIAPLGGYGKPVAKKAAPKKAVPMKTAKAMPKSKGKVSKYSESSDSDSESE